MKLILVTLALLAMKIKGESAVIPDTNNDGYYLKLIEEGKPKSLEAILS
jgi:hypothetical protein